VKPVFNVLAGPNGSGKSTLANRLKAEGYSLGKMINPDEIAVQLRTEGLSGKNIEFEAGRRALRQTKDMIAKRQSFARETTLSSKEILRTMGAANKAGYEVNLIFVGLSSLDMNKDRVALRAAKGGHDIPLDAQNRRFDKAMNNLPKAISLAENVQLFDNSSQRHILVATVQKQEVTFVYPDKASWLPRALKGLKRSPFSQSQKIGKTSKINPILKR